MLIKTIGSNAFKLTKPIELFGNSGMFHPVDINPIVAKSAIGNPTAAEVAIDLCIDNPSHLKKGTLMVPPPIPSNVDKKLITKPEK